MAWYWWIVIVVGLISIGLLKMIIMRRYHQKKKSKHRLSDYDEG